MNPSVTPPQLVEIASLIADVAQAGFFFGVAVGACLSFALAFHLWGRK